MITSPIEGDARVLTRDSLEVLPTDSPSLKCTNKNYRASFSEAEDWTNGPVSPGGRNYKTTLFQNIISDAAKRDMTTVDSHKFNCLIGHKGFVDEATSRKRSARPVVNDVCSATEEDVTISMDFTRTQHIRDRQAIDATTAAAPRSAKSTPKDPTNGVTKVGVSKNRRTSCWKTLRPVIHDLYIGKNHTLQDLQQRLKQDHNFHASKSSYKRRLREWDLVKNHNSKKLEQISQTMNESGLDQMQGYSVGEINLDAQSSSLLTETHHCDENVATASTLSHGPTTMQCCENWDSHDWPSTLFCPVLDADIDPHKNSPNSSTAPRTMENVCKLLTDNEEFDVCNLSGLTFKLEAGLIESINGTTNINPSTYSHDVYGSCSFEEQYKLLACPFTKCDPARFSERNPVEVKYRRCSTVKLLGISRLKEHLHRVHLYPEHYCPTCFDLFKNNDELQLHHQQPGACKPRDNPFYERIDHAQMSAIKKEVLSRDRKAAWFAIFRILFPGRVPPLSPYVDSVDSRNAEEFIQFLKQSLPMLQRIFMDKLRTVTSIDDSADKCVENVFQAALVMFLSILSSHRANIGALLKQRSLTTPRPTESKFSDFYSPNISKSHSLSQADELIIGWNWGTPRENEME